MKISIKFLSILVLLFTVSLPSYGQYKWVMYSSDQDFVALQDTIDKGSVIFHKLAQNNSSVTGHKGVFFNNVKIFEFPSLTTSFTRSASQIRGGQVSVYPHIFTASNGAATLSVATMLNVAHVDPVKGMRTRPSISPESISKIENDSITFSKLKFVTGDRSVEIALQTNLQETDLLIDDYEVTYSYWLKSAPTTKELEEMLTFFTNSMMSLQVRAYGDKGYLDTTLEGKQLDNLRIALSRTLELNKKINDALAPAPAPAAARTPAARAPVRKQAPATRTVNTNTRPVTTRVVRPS